MRSQKVRAAAPNPKAYQQSRVTIVKPPHTRLVPALTQAGRPGALGGGGDGAHGRGGWWRGVLDAAGPGEREVGGLGSPEVGDEQADRGDRRADQHAWAQADVGDAEREQE